MHAKHTCAPTERALRRLTFARSADERERVLEALEELPSQMAHSEVVSISRASKSIVQSNPATWEPGHIILYDQAFSNKHLLGRIIAHETAHQIFFDLKEEDRNDYRWAANWLAKDKKRTDFFGRATGYVQDDGRASPEEDFANNVEYLLFDEPALIKTTPQAHRWLRSYFGASFKLSELKKSQKGSSQ